MKTFDGREFSRWFDFEFLKKKLPGREFATSDQVVITQVEYNNLIDNLTGNSKKFIGFEKLDMWNEFYADFYPVNRLTHGKIDKIAISLIHLSNNLDLLSRSGFRKAVLVSGKEQIWFTLTAGHYDDISYEGYYCRPFRYVNL